MKWEITKKFSAQSKRCFSYWESHIPLEGKSRSPETVLLFYPGTGVKPSRNVICFSPIFLGWNGHRIMKECLKKADQAFPR
jgi:hypothetical protein